MFRKSVFAAACIGAVAMSGCTSIGSTVSNEKLEERTAFALGLDKGEFTISNPTKDGLSTYYSVKTNRGAEYRCYVSATLVIVSQTVSDAICTKKGEPARNPLTR